MRAQGTAEMWRTDPNGSSTLAAVAVNGSILTLGGKSPGAARDTVEEFSPGFNVWVMQPRLPSARNECFAALLEDGYCLQSSLSGISAALMDGLLPPGWPERA